MLARALLACCFGIAAVPAPAQTDRPDAAAAPGPICTDRPTRSNVACTVPKGMWQVEADAVSWSVLQTAEGRTDLFQFTNAVLKYGVGGRTDVNVAWAPYARATTDAGGVRSTVDGVGDVVLRVKQRLTPAGTPGQFALIPYVKLPTAPAGIGNGAWEGGVIATLNYSLPRGFTLTIVPSLDLLQDADGRGRHGQVTGLVNVGRQFGRTTLYGELWTAQNFDPSGTVAQYSADIAVAHLLSDGLQLDIGGNFGLNRVTPDAQLYLGISARW